jgi:hypothetical protein
MSFGVHLEEFGGLPVVGFSRHPDAPLPVVDGKAAFRIDCYYDDEYSDWGGDWIEFIDIWERFLAKADTTRVTALTIGMWDESTDPRAHYPVAEVLADSAGRLPALRSLFVGDICPEGSDVAYISHGDLTPMLHRLVYQSGGLPAETIRAVGECDLPALQHLEFYFGSPRYGGNATPADVDWLLGGRHFPNLTHLGLRDSELQDEIAAAVAIAPIVSRLKTLDLSLGTLGDEGAAALLAGQPLTHLAKLDLSCHYLSDEMQQRLSTAWPGVEVDLSDPQTEYEGHRSIAVAE